MSEAPWGPCGGPQCVLPPSRQVLHLWMYATLNYLPLFSLTKIWQSFWKQVFYYCFLIPKQVQAHQLNIFHHNIVIFCRLCAPAVVRLLSNRFQMLSMSRVVLRNKVPPKKSSAYKESGLMGCSQNLNDIKSDLLLEQMGNTQYTYWSGVLLKSKTSNTTLWKKWSELLTKIHHQHRQRAGRVKGQRWKSSLETKYSAAEASLWFTGSLNAYRAVRGCSYCGD